jgi:hypothetical protein
MQGVRCGDNPGCTSAAAQVRNSCRTSQHRIPQPNAKLFTIVCQNIAELPPHFGHGSQVVLNGKGLGVTGGGRALAERAQPASQPMIRSLAGTKPS